MLPTNTTASTGGVKLQKLKSSEDIGANTLFVIKRGILIRLENFIEFFNNHFFYN